MISRKQSRSKKSPTVRARHVARAPIEIKRAGKAFHLILPGPVQPQSLRFATRLVVRGAIISSRAGTKGRISRAEAIRRLSRIRVKTWTRRGMLARSTLFTGVSVAPLTPEVQDKLIKFIRSAARRGGPLDQKRVGNPLATAGASDVVITDEEAAEDDANSDSDVVVTDEEAAEDEAIADSDVVVTDEEAAEDWNSAFTPAEEPGLVHEAGVEAIIDLISEGLPVAEGALIVEGALEGLYEWMMGD